MKVKHLTHILAAAIVAFGFGAAYAFHSGGVAECVGCHSMHDPGASDSLLKFSDPSSTCLDCHESEGDTGPRSYHISTPGAELAGTNSPKQLSPGGDFGWIKKTYNWTVRGAYNTEYGYTHGHNIIAADYTYIADGVNTTAPGSAFPNSELSCISCHDPHGRYRRLPDGSVSTTGGVIIGSGSYDSSAVPAAGEAVGVYRLLYGLNKTVYTGLTFGGVPAAVTPATYNRSEATTQTRTVYGQVSGAGHDRWGDWCSTCHTDMHSDNEYVHPVDQALGSTIIGIYNSYRKSGDLTGDGTTSFLSLVPFVDQGVTYADMATKAKNNDSVLTGPDDGDRVTCMSCHRAHASGFEFMLRWQGESEFLTYAGAWPGTENSGANYARGRTSAETQQAYYGRPASKFATYQRSLCNKCHAKD